jgi:hypothetical protein
MIRSDHTDNRIQIPAESIIPNKTLGNFVMPELPNMYTFSSISVIASCSSLHHRRRPTPRPPAQDDYERIEDHSALIASHPFYCRPLLPTLDLFPLFRHLDNVDQCGWLSFIFDILHTSGAAITRTFTCCRPLFFTDAGAS